MIRYWNVGLVAACIFSLWLMASFPNQKFNQNHLHHMNRIWSRSCHSSKNSSRKCSCLCEGYAGTARLQAPGESDGVDRVFRRVIQLLDRSNSVSYDALLLWLNLQRGKSEKEVESSQLADVPPKRPLHLVGSSCWTCAVVGISRSLWSSSVGSMINQQDLVLRRNWAPPVQGFEADVGNETTAHDAP
ncbi:CMP-N-acetylneuraminate-beta-galactosamide-alpha-2,3-sialyltransferase 1-like [Dipodomys merriami]|uniref:CMP-N-acetylneuraminate-beta-galactosamide- alpha-2,3-sialyltransferase 1-like n=1 Tax=Dipodomys merriami TaxID=94247 RepID=UPI0038560513